MAKRLNSSRRKSPKRTASTQRHSRIAQIVVTRKDAKTFQVTTFDKKQCLGGPLLDADATLKYIGRELKRLAQTRSLE